MLIDSPRHTARDLELWAELEGADRVHGERFARSGKVEQSIEEIRRFASAGECCATVSWGKDSVVMAHLVWRSGCAVSLVHLRSEGVANPHCMDVRDAFLSRFPMPYREVPVRYEKIDMLGIDELQVDGNRTWFSAIRAQGSRHISGIRSDESGGRKIRFRKFGLSSPNACAPLGWWKANDCFGYLAANGLPVHPSYAMLGGGRWPRDHIRVDELAGATGNNYGRREWEQQYYGDILRRLEARASRPNR